jgi:tetratricopeptide (TPR) repeat protein
VAVVSGSAPADSVATMMRDSRFAAPVLVDAGDALYASLGLALHPVVVVVGRDKKLAAFEPFRAVDFCPVVSARIRHVLREISDDELAAALAPPKATQGGNGQVARRYRAFAEALFKDKSYDKALENVRKSLDKDPMLAPAHALLGQILLAQERCADAIPAFDQALALEPDNASAREGLARCKAGR